MMWSVIRDKLRSGDARRRRRQAASAAPPDDGKVRLNLGSGDKNLPGYINVDVALSRNGISPDVLCDLRQLKFADAYADEVMAIHVIEHFYQWEIQDLLAEWKRVLKPGGRIVLECPNMLHAARMLVEDETRAANRDKGWAQTMFVLYGDPSWKDPLMCHRWGWTPRTLAHELEKAGFRDAHEEPAVFKKGNPRDIRVVATKP